MTSKDDPINDYANQNIPYSEEAEKACIGGVIVDSQPLAIITKFLNPDKFYILRHRYIWEAIDYLHKRGETIDYLTLTQRLKETNKLGEIGGMVYLTQLINAAPNTTNTESYAQLVERAAIRRQGLAAADEIKKHFMDEKIAVEQVLENAQSVLTAVKPPMSRTKPASMKEVMSSLFDQFDYRIEKGIHQLGIPTGFKQFDAILGGWRKNRLYVVGGRPGMGKCLGKGTKVLRFDGTFVNVEDIQVNDLLMGSDSTPRRVLALGHGQEMMYWVHQNKGISYRVNSSHILSLKRSKNEGKHKRGDVLNISVNDAIQKGNGFFARYKGYKTAVEYPSKPLPLPPYFVGLWLGDGTTKNSSITTMDNEIVEYLSNLADSIGGELTHYDSSGTRCPTYTINTGRWAKLNIQSSLRELKLLNNKHIPHDYLVNSRENRLLLLAGLIDSDGHYQSTYNTYEVVSVIQPLAEQIKILADSLGYRTSLISKSTSSQTGFVGKAYRVRISGDVSEIPILIERKKPRPCSNQKDWKVTGIRVEPDKIDDFYGFELDGDGLFLLEDMTVTHNTGLMLECGIRVANSCNPQTQKPYKVLFVSMEMSAEELGERLISNKARLSTQQILGSEFTDDQRKAMIAALGELSKSSLFLDDKEKTLTPTILENKCRDFIADNGSLDMLIVDYLQLMTPDKPNKSREVEVASISRDLKMMSRYFHIPIMVGCQLNREVEKRKNKRATLADLRESGAIEQDADVVIFPFFPGYYQKPRLSNGEFEVSIAKHRNGQLGSAKLKADWRYMDFTEGYQI